MSIGAALMFNNGVNVTITFAGSWLEDRSFLLK
ncbi:hypothetical protein V172_03000 [Citrobacter freundii RLS1]|nr:hypothetical protein V172_03000 [Citrobacter freundii RLS1]